MPSENTRPLGSFFRALALLGPVLLSETAPLDSEATERSDEKPSLSRCYPSPKSQCRKGDSS
jgi:hypothetical protein